MLWQVADEHANDNDTIQVNQSFILSNLDSTLMVSYMETIRLTTLISRRSWQTSPCRKDSMVKV